MFRDLGAIVSSIVVVAVVAVVEILSLSSWSTEICRIGEFAFAEFECTVDPCFHIAFEGLLFYETPVDPLF